MGKPISMREVMYEVSGENLEPGEYLRGLRIHAGLSQDEMVKITGIARNNISAIENGRRELSAHYAMLFAAALQVHPAEILFPNGRWKKNEEIKLIEKRAAALLKKRG